jgi:hypothetical protein
MVLLLAVTIVSTSVAIAMSAVAWHAWREERRRSEARIAALAADIAQDGSMNALDRISPPGQAAGYDLFTITRHSEPQSRRGFALVAGVLAIAVSAVLAVNFSGESRAGSVVPASPGASVAGAPGALSGPAPRTDAAPLELVALGHERVGDHLIVRGAVLNPISGTGVNQLIAVVSGFNGDGEFLSSGQSAVAAPVLGPGAQSSFTVTLTGAAGVVRYRVSFRTDDRVVPHADRRPKG